MVQRLPDPPLAPTSQEGGGLVSDNTGGMPGKGSPPVSPVPDPADWAGAANLPFPRPEALAGQIGVSTGPGHNGGQGLPHNLGQSEGKFTTGNQPGGRQGAGGGASGPGGKWTPTPSARG
jgi:hypothetical protein